MGLAAAAHALSRNLTPLVLEAGPSVGKGDALWRSAWLLTGDHQLAEDLVQTALFKAALTRAIEEWIVPVERLRA